MKLAIIFLAVLGLACGKPLPSSSIQEDLKEFLENVPTEKVLEIVLDYLYYDNEVKDFVVHIQSEEFPKIHKFVEYLQEYKDCFKFVNEHGVDVYAIVKEIHDTLGYPPYEPMNNARNGVGFRGLIEDVIEVLPLDELKTLYEKEPQIRECVKTLYKAIQSPEIRKIVNSLRDWPEYKEIRDYLQRKGIDVEPYMELLRTLYSLSKKGLHYIREDMIEFMELVPPQKFYEIVMDYLSNDPEVKEFFVYIQSEEFPRIHKVVEYLKEYKPCLRIINDVDVYAVINKIYHTLGFPPTEPTNTTRTGYGFYGLVEDMIAVFPIEELKALVEKKMETREYLKPLVPVYKTLVKTIQSPGFKKMVETVRARMVDTVRPMIFDFLRNWPLYQEQFKMLREKVLVPYMELLRTIYSLSKKGLHYLREDMIEYMALVPPQKFYEIAVDYLTYDPEVKQFVLHIQSEEFPHIHKIVEYLKQFKPCLTIINEGDVYAIINKICHTLGFPPIEPTNTTRTGYGFNGLKEDMIAVFPLEELKTLVENKMETREYLKPLVPVYETVVKTIQSPVFKKMVKTVQTTMVDTVRPMILDIVRNWPEYQKRFQMLQEKVLDKDLILEIFKELGELAWEVINIIKDDLEEFIPLVPKEKILEITMEYLAYDPKYQDILVYIQSEEFPMIHKVVEYLKGYKDRLLFINEHGVDIYAIVKVTHETLGYPPYEPTNNPRSGVGFRALTKDVIAAFPHEELKTYVETRPYFKPMVATYKTLVKTIQSPEIRNMVESARSYVLDTVRSWPEYKKVVQMLREKDFDEEHVIELLRELSELFLRETYNLKNDLEEFMTLVPTDKFLDITLDYLTYDPELQDFLAYIQSEEFPLVHSVVEYLKGYKDRLQFIDEHGVNFYEIVKYIHDTLGYPPFEPTGATRTGVGFRGLIKDLIAAFPLEDFKAYVENKLETREYFKVLVSACKTLVATIKSPEFRNMVECVRAFMLDTLQTVTEHQRLLEILREMGVNVDRIIEHLWKLFTWTPF